MNNELSGGYPYLLYENNQQKKRKNFWRWKFFVLRFQASSQDFKGFGHVFLHGLLGNAQSLSYFFVLHAVETAHQEDFPATGR